MTRLKGVRCTGAVVALTCGLLAAPTLLAQGPGVHQDTVQRAIFKELLELNTSQMGGDVSRATRAVQHRLRAAGYALKDVPVVGGSPKCLNLVATLRGRDATAKPVLLLAHLDVVSARPSDWKYDPYILREAGGWFYGRGALDNKAGASILIANMVRWKRERFTPLRDVIMVLTCDEESTAEGGIQWLIAHVPRLSTADYALNTDAGGVSETKGGKMSFDISAAEKVYATFELTARNPGGHSSLPRPDNAIYALAAALGRLSAYTFPVTYNDVSRTSFTRSAELESGQLADDMRAAGRGETSGPAIDRLSSVTHLSPQLRTTCVATMLRGGHAENALPQAATATVNCRVFPSVAIADVEKTLVRVAADTSITVTLTYQPVASPPSPLRPDIVPAIERLAAEFFKNAVAVPSMSNGASDGLYLRNVGVPVYGVSALEMAPEDDRSHGLDERVPVASLYKAREFWYRMVKELLTKSPAATS